MRAYPRSGRSRRRGLFAAMLILVAIDGSAAQTGQAPAQPNSVRPGTSDAAAGKIPGSPLLGGFPRGRPPTPAQQLVNALHPPKPGGRFPVPPLPAGAPLPSADPRDLQGTWYHDQNLELRNQRDMFDQPVPFTEAGAATLIRRATGIKKGTPYLNASGRCRPPGPMWQHDLNFPFQIFATANGFEILFEEYHGRWNIAFDPAKLPSGKEYMGRSVAHWDGGTLVVETSGFKQAMWMDSDGTPISANARLIHRIRKVNFGDRQPYLEAVITIDDPVNYTRPWSAVRLFNWYPDATNFKEYNCEEQIGDASVDANAGLVPEPKN